MPHFLLFFSTTAIPPIFGQVSNKTIHFFRPTQIQLKSNFGSTLVPQKINHPKNSPEEPSVKQNLTLFTPTPAPL